MCSRRPGPFACRLVVAALASATLTLTAPVARAQTTVAFDFAGPALDPRLTAPDARDGLTYRVSEGLQINQAAGYGAAAPYTFRPAFALAGDFEIELAIGRSGLGRGELGLFLTDVAGGPVGSFTADRAAVIGTTFVPTFVQVVGGGRTLIPVTVTVTRNGGRIRMSYRDGPSSGLIFEAADAALAGLVVPSVGFQNRSADDGPKGGVLGGFRVAGTLVPLGTTVPEPATWLLLGTGLVGTGLLGAAARARRHDAS